MMDLRLRYMYVNYISLHAVIEPICNDMVTVLQEFVGVLTRLHGHFKKPDH
jgi:hypothetical protein